MNQAQTPTMKVGTEESTIASRKNHLEPIMRPLVHPIMIVDGIKNLPTEEGKIRIEIPKIEGKIRTEIPRVEGMIQTEIPMIEGKIRTEIPTVEGMIQTEIPMIEGMIQVDKLRIEGMIWTETPTAEGRIRIDVPTIEEMIRKDMRPIEVIGTMTKMNTTIESEKEVVVVIELRIIEHGNNLENKAFLPHNLIANGKINVDIT